MADERPAADTGLAGLLGHTQAVAGRAPLPFPHGLTACGSRRLWARGGHFGASQVPGLTIAGPGGIDIEQLTGSARRAGGAGRQAAAATVPGVHGLDRYLGDEEAAGAEPLSRVG